MSAVELKVPALVAYRTRGIYFVKLVVYVDLVVVKRRKARVDEVLHALLEGIFIEMLNEFKYSLFFLTSWKPK